MYDMNDLPIYYAERIIEADPPHPPWSPCWLWTGPIDHKGYPLASASATGHKWNTRAHRNTYRMFAGAIPDDRPHLDHPGHLEPVTPGENVRRGYRNGTETHCKDGHERTPENTYTHTHPTTGRVTTTCRGCRRDRMREYMRQRRANTLTS